MTAVEPVAGGVRVRLHIQPRAARTEIAGPFGDAVKIRVTSAPVEGAANDELIRFLADLLEVPRANLQLVAGHSGRRKTVRIQGVAADQVRRCLGLRPLTPDP